MSAIAAHYASAAASSDRRYADLAAHYDPAAFFHYSQPSLTAVTAASLDGPYSFSATPTNTTPSYSAWDAHEPGPAPSPSYSASSISSASANPYSNSSGSTASTSHPSVTASFSYPGRGDYSAPSHRSFPSRSTHHHTAPSSSSSSAHAPSTSNTSGLRQSYSSGARSYSSLTAATTTSTTPGTSSSSTPRLQNASWDDSALYTIEPSDPVASTSSQHAYSHSSASSPLTAPPTPPIKEEDPDGGFIIEVSVPSEPIVSSMPEVPLRAIHAPPKMRKMMCTFRLENFAIHDGIRSAATQPGPGGIEVGPLKESPVEFEWQIQLTVPLIPEEDEAFQYAAAPRDKSHTYARYRDPGTPASPRAVRAHVPTSPRRARAEFPSAASASPTLSLEYPAMQVESEAWDGSSGYGDNGSGSTTAASAGSPTFTSIMTPAQSLGWSMRYHTSEADVDSSSNYQRHSVVQPSLSRVSQTQSRYAFGGSTSKTSYPLSQQQHAQYGYDSGGGYSRDSASAGRYAPDTPVYASSGSGAATWFRS
ncbi:hypothetical protein C8Q79DRAFT_218246 [Trametes meyenii]|nr:hypothetical protein C8Q79DRAFT_218246 [Trametes meyenii]